MKAALNNYRQSPRKVALVAGLIRGKTAAEALRSLQFTVKRASDPVLKLLESAIANARNAGISDVESLIVKEIQVNKGVTLKRIMPRARGSASRINKRSSHVTIILAEAAPKVSLKKPKAAKKATK
ncbi:MAG: hypothetical protein RL094_192 [Candidatus Parcubacteria bacterium]|jgi:large subunit ribosomal protein L22